MWRLLTHVLIKIILYKIYHFLCLLWINSLPWKAWVMLCGDGCWLYLSLCWLKMRNKGGRDYIKSQERKWTHAVCCNSGLSDFLMCSCMNDLGWKMLVVEKKITGKYISFGVFLGGWEVGWRKRTNDIRRTIFVLMTGILMEKWMVQSQTYLQSCTFS